MDEKVCCVKECDLPVLALGLCNKHWHRTRNYGSPVALARQSWLMRGKSAIERFELQHRKGEGCWHWTSSLDSDGYGRFDGTIHGVRYTKAHRFSWALHSGAAIPENMIVCHSCDNPKCVNPAHLWLGTNDDNMKDKVSKGRSKWVVGGAHGNATLTEQQVREILNDPKPHSYLAEKYGVTTMTISDIKCRRSWKHLVVDEVARAKRVGGRRGISVGNRVTPEIVLDIRSSEKSGKALAEQYKLSPQMICAIRKRRAWAHV